MPGETVGRQVLQFLGTCGLGFLLGLYYEFFRSVRLWSPPSVGVCIFQDIFFCLSSALVTFFVLLGLADGNMYPYLFIGEGIGFLVFYGSLGNVIHKILLWILRLLTKIFKGIQRKVFTPVYRWLTQKFWKAKGILVEKCKKTKKTQKKSIFFSKKS